MLTPSSFSAVASALRLPYRGVTFARYARRLSSLTKRPSPTIFVSYWFCVAPSCILSRVARPLPASIFALRKWMSPRKVEGKKRSGYARLKLYKRVADASTQD